MNANKRIMRSYSNVEKALLQFHKELETIEREGSMTIPQQCYELLTFMAEYNEQVVFLIDNEKK